MIDKSHEMNLELDRFGKGGQKKKTETISGVAIVWGPSRNRKN